jgi:hypothetical protein
VTRETPVLAPGALAGIDLVGRTGTVNFEISDDDGHIDVAPPVWDAAATYQRRGRDL